MVSAGGAKLYRNLAVEHFDSFLPESLEQSIGFVPSNGHDDCMRLLAKLDAEGISVFYTKVPIEFGTTGEEQQR